MRRFGFTRRFASFLTTGLLAVISAFFTLTVVRAQEVALCAAPASALGSAYVTVNGDQAQVNVRGGPNSYQYGKIGILFTYESAPALGRSPGGDWIQICCPGAAGGAGWVYAANVTLTAPGDLPIIAVAPTSTPLFTATVDVTLAVAFPSIQATPTRLPTFTPAPAQTLPVFTEAANQPLHPQLPASLIIAIFVVGLAILLVSFFIKH